MGMNFLLRSSSRTTSIHRNRKTCNSFSWSGWLVAWINGTYDDDNVQHDCHTPANRSTEVSSLGLQCKTFKSDIHVMVN